MYWKLVDCQTAAPAWAFSAAASGSSSEAARVRTLMLRDRVLRVNLFIITLL